MHHGSPHKDEHTRILFLHSILPLETKIRSIECILNDNSSAVIYYSILIITFIFNLVYKCTARRFIKYVAYSHQSNRSKKCTVS